MSKKSVLMRVNVSGYAGAPTSVLAAYDPNTDVLAISREQAYDGKPLRGFLTITNSDRDESFDALFTEDDFKEAISAYFELESLRLISLKDAVQRANPASKIERDKVDESGMAYRISPDIACAQVAVLVACLYARRQRSAGAAMDMAADFLAIAI